MDCPKCRTGKLAKDKDMYGHFIFCRNCGWTRDIDFKGVLIAPNPTLQIGPLGVRTLKGGRHSTTPKSGKDSYKDRNL